MPLKAHFLGYSNTRGNNRKWILQCADFGSILHISISHASSQPRNQETRGLHQDHRKINGKGIKLYLVLLVLPNNMTEFCR